MSSFDFNSFMSTPANPFPAPLALIVLLFIHTAVSYGACRWMSHPTLVWEKNNQSPIETTTPDQQARGEKSFIIGSTHRLFSPVSIPVLCYIGAGYAGLGLAVIIALAGWLRHVNA